MPLTNVAKDTEYLEKLIEMKRYYRDETKIKELLAKADEVLEKNDYANRWAAKRKELLLYLKDMFHLDEKSAAYIKLTNITGDSNNASYSFTIEIGKSPIEPQYGIGTEDSVEYLASDINRGIVMR